MTDAKWRIAGSPLINVNLPVQDRERRYHSWFIPHGKFHYVASASIVYYISAAGFGGTLDALYVCASLDHSLLIWRILLLLSRLRFLSISCVGCTVLILYWCRLLLIDNLNLLLLRRLLLFFHLLLVRHGELARVRHAAIDTSRVRCHR